MSTGIIVPCLWLDDHAEQAAAFYTKLLPGGRIRNVSHYPESADNPSGKPRGSVLTVEFEVAGRRFTALNGGPLFVINPSISFFLHVASAAEADRLFGALAEGGKVLMPLGSYPWSERYGWVADRFGVSWQVLAERPTSGGSTIVPCLMFTGMQRGRAEAALQLYTRVFPDSRIDSLARYTAAEGPEGMIKHGRCVLAGQELVAMDSHAQNEVRFDEGLSLQVMCRDQAEIDHYWKSLCDGGTPGPCGWLKDRFGLSWQIVPDGIAELLTSTDKAARDRVFAAMMKMGKPDIATLQAAFERRL